MKQWLSLLLSGDEAAKRLDAAVDLRLRAAVTPPPAADPRLQASIMRAVRQGTGLDAAPTFRFRLAWALPVLLVGLLAGWFVLRPSTPHPAESANTSGPVTTLPDAAWQGAAWMVQPLDEELANLGRDWERTREFLLASLP